ncbi:MAG: hypothetical protein HS115_12125 [Spirochaetales bacterium]|nr:hypothetical protein [Spirochaetales bacterium]
MEKIYPNLILINAQGYDPYDSVVEGLFYNLVYGTFAEKYGTIVPPECCWVYEMTPRNGDALPAQFVEVIAKAPRFRSPPPDVLHAQFDSDRFGLLFLNFGDAQHYLTSGLTREDAKRVRFNLSRVALFDRKAALFCGEEFWLELEGVEFAYNYSSDPRAA